jgi:hypothetical protein
MDLARYFRGHIYSPVNKPCFSMGCKNAAFGNDFDLLKVAWKAYTTSKQRLTRGVTGVARYTFDMCLAWQSLGAMRPGNLKGNWLFATNKNAPRSSGRLLLQR